MIYIASALISFFITTALIMTALYLKLLYYAVIDNTKKFLETIIKSMNER